MWQIFTLALCKSKKIIYTVQQDKCKCKNIWHVSVNDLRLHWIYRPYIRLLTLISTTLVRTLKGTVFGIWVIWGLLPHTGLSFLEWPILSPSQRLTVLSFYEEPTVSIFKNKLELSEFQFHTLKKSGIRIWTWFLKGKQKKKKFNSGSENQTQSNLVLTDPAQNQWLTTSLPPIQLTPHSSYFFQIHYFPSNIFGSTSKMNWAVGSKSGSGSVSLRK